MQAMLSHLASSSQVVSRATVILAELPDMVARPSGQDDNHRVPAYAEAQAALYYGVDGGAKL